MDTRTREIIDAEILSNMPDNEKKYYKKTGIYPNKKVMGIKEE